MTTREEALSYGLSFPGAYQDAPFHDPNWQLVRIEGSRKSIEKQNSGNQFHASVEAL